MARQRFDLRRVFVLTRGTSLRRRVAYSLAIVRLILVPVILLAIYYLFAMGAIVDRIVRVDATVAMQAERASIQMLDARRAERNYLLLQDPNALAQNRQAIDQLEKTVETCQRLEPEEATTISSLLADIHFYREGMDQVAARMKQGGAPVHRVRVAVQAYERNLDQLLRRAGRLSHAQLVQQLHARTNIFDAGISAAGARDPVLQNLAKQLENTSNSVLSLSAGLEERSWQRVESDHRRARGLFRRTEWVVGIVSALTLLVSIWVSFVLPREVVRPLLDLKTAVDHAAAGNYEIEFDLQGKGEVVDLAKSVRQLIAHLREKKEEAEASEARRGTRDAKG
jgi:nitrogen fixation/metabolism regulation signal transduction histidine kinase